MFLKDFKPFYFLTRTSQCQTKRCPRDLSPAPPAVPASDSKLVLARLQLQKLNRCPLRVAASGSDTREKQGDQKQVRAEGEPWDDIITILTLHAPRAQKAAASGWANSVIKALRHILERRELEEMAWYRESGVPRPQRWMALMGAGCAHGSPSLPLSHTVGHAIGRRLAATAAGVSKNLHTAHRTGCITATKTGSKRMWPHRTE